MKEFLQQPWAIAAYGWFFLNLFIWFVEKNKTDAKKEKFDYGNFFVTHLDNWAISLVATPFIIVYGQDIHAFNMEILAVLSVEAIGVDLSFKWYDIFYGAAVPFTEFWYFAIITWLPVIKVKSTEILQKWFGKKLSD